MEEITIKIVIDFSGLCFIAFMILAIAFGYQGRKDRRRKLVKVATILSSIIFILVGLLAGLIVGIGDGGLVGVGIVLLILGVIIFFIWLINCFWAWLGWIIGGLFR
jgi:hypothetical protein